MIRPLLAITLLTCIPCAAQGDRSPVEPRSLPAPDQTVAPVKPSVEKIDDSRFRIGQVTFDKTSREIRFPAQINMSEGLLEYLVVHEKGKLHESLFSTTTSPTDINLAFTLLRYPPSRELYPLPNDTGGVTSDRMPDVPEAVRAAARITIEVEWDDEGKTRRLPVSEWIQHTVTAKSMPAGPWVYGGSEFHQGQYAPETTGDIAAIFVAMSALINYPGQDNRDDTVWVVFPKRVPTEGTKVTLIIAPYKNPIPSSKP